MYCRNCGNEVSDKAVACPKCGVNPKTEKAFCSSCGVATNDNQVACTQCGVSLAGTGFNFDTAALQKVDVQAFVRKKSLLFGSIALLGCFLPWIKINAFIMVQSLSFFQLSKVVDVVPSSILVSFILYLFPLCLLGFVLSEFVPQIAKYKNLFSIGSLVLLIYTIVGLYLAAHPSTPDVPQDQNNMFGGMAAAASEMAKDMISTGIGLYITAIATVASFVFAKKGQ